MGFTITCELRESNHHQSIAHSECARSYDLWMCRYHLGAQVAYPVVTAIGVVIMRYLQASEVFS